MLLKKTLEKKEFNERVIINSEKCPRCGKGTLVNDDEIGEIVCAVCGFVLFEKTANIDSENGFFDNHKDKRRTGDSITLTRHDMGLSTMINSTNRDAMGKPITTDMVRTIERIRKWDNLSRNDPADKNLRNAFNELIKMKDKLVLSKSVIEKAAYIYRKAFEKKLTKGRTTSSIMAACLYAACRDSETPRTIKDIVTVTNIRKK